MVNPGEARILMDRGWRAADLHVHTLYSHDVIPTAAVDPLALYLKARRDGMAYVAFTDHDTMAAYDNIGWTREGLVPAVEVKILDPKNVGHTIHINVYTLDRAQFREIEKIAGAARDIVLLAAYFRDERLPFIFNHPFWHEPGEKPNLRAVVEVAELFPVLEYNMGRVGRINAQALRLAGVLGKGVVAATDSHVGEIGRAFTLAGSGSFREFFDDISARRARICPADLTLPRLKEETSERVRTLFDKASWIRAKKTLSIDTGSAILDGIVRRVAREEPRGPGRPYRLLAKAIEAVSRSGIPGSLYLRAQNSLADRVSRVLESAGTAA
jgi:predicted metal-dependent phosphoesterase TrpH